MRRLQQNPDTRAAMTAPRDAMPPSDDEAAVLALLGDEPLDEAELAARLDWPPPTLQRVLARCRARGTATPSSAGWRRAAR